MKRSFLAPALLALFTVSVPTLPAFAAAGARELAGSYILPDGEWEKIEATFVANGSDSWAVEFRFDFQGRSETWTGNASGSLTDGPIEGAVEVADMGRSFVFRGEVADGVLEAEHAEIEFGGETPTGTMTLGPVESDEDPQQNTENTLRLAEGATRPEARISEVAWMAGYWKGMGLGGELVELWMPPEGDRMHGVFTLNQDGAPSFSEAMLLIEEEGSLALRVKHFTPEFVGWEEKDGFVSFPLVRLAENEAYFNGLTLRRRGNELLIYIVLSSGGERTEHELVFERAPL